MAINYTVDYYKCYEDEIFGPDETPPPPSLLYAAMAHIFLVVVLGTLCNGVAIWCVVTCKKTRTAVKVLLCSVFIPSLLICLVTRTMRIPMMFAVLHCEAERTTYIYRLITGLLYSFLTRMELACITALAIVRTVAVWSPKRHTIRLRVAVSVVICIFIYTLFSGVGLLGVEFSGYVSSKSLINVLTFVYFFANVMVPFIVTAIAYALMLFAMRRNKQRLAVLESHTNKATTLDQATQAMMAVFVSNFIFGFPHAVYHLSITKYTHILELIFHMLFYTHFVVDPLVFIWYNSNYRQRVSERIHECWKLVVSCCGLSCCNTSCSPSNPIRKISSTLPLWKSSVSLSQHSSSTPNHSGIQLGGGVLTQSEV